MDDGVLDWVAINRLKSFSSAKIASLTHLRMDVSSSLGRFPSGILSIDLKQASQPVIGKSAYLTCLLLQAGNYSEARFGDNAAHEDTTALIHAVFRSGGRLRMTVTRIHDIAKAIYHVHPGVAQIEGQERKSELQRLLELP